MNRKTCQTIAFMTFPLLVVLSASRQAQAQSAQATYPSMAPLDQYMMERNAEIALARSAAPNSISQEAEVIIMGRHGYETASKGKNGFVCIVQRSWTAGFDDPEFWNPKIRAPICFNPPAVRSYLPQTVKKTEWALAGKSKAQIAAELQAALVRKQLPPLETGAMCYMLSKQGYLNDQDGHWHPHLMFFVPLTDPGTWGANLPGTGVIASKDPEGRLTVFLIPVRKWSDGSADSEHEH